MKICANFLISIVASALLVACGATGSVTIITEEPLQLEPKERVAIIAYLTPYSTSEKLAVLTKCFIKSFNSNIENVELINIDLTPFQVISVNDPLGIFFTEDSTFDFCKMKSHPIFQDEIMTLRLRYLILLEVAYYREFLSSGEWYEIECSYPPGGIGCGGLNMWDSQTYMKATILDLNKKQTLGELEAEYNSRSWILAIGLPVAGNPDVSDTEACKALGKSVATLFQSNK